VSHYTYRAEWSPQDGEYVGLCAEFPSLSWLAPTADKALAGIELVVDDVVADMTATGEKL
jgi:predicted RNase H-like HicB family nuclease